MSKEYVSWNQHSNCDCININIKDCSLRKINKTSIKCKMSLAEHVCKHVIVDKKGENWHEITPFHEKYKSKSEIFSIFNNEQSRYGLMNEYQDVGKRIYEHPLFAYRCSPSPDSLADNYLGRGSYLGVLTGINVKNKKMSTIFKTYKFGGFGNFLIKASRKKIGDWLIEPPTIQAYKLLESNTLKLAFTPLSFRFCDLLDTLNDVENFYRKYKDNKEYQNEFLFSVNVLSKMVNVAEKKLEKLYSSHKLILNVYKNSDFFNIEAEKILSESKNDKKYREFVKTLIETNYQSVKELDNIVDVERETSSIVHHIGIMQLAALFSNENKPVSFQNQFIEEINREYKVTLSNTYNA